MRVIEFHARLLHSENVFGYWLDVVDHVINGTRADRVSGTFVGKHNK